MTFKGEGNILNRERNQMGTIVRIISPQTLLANITNQRNSLLEIPSYMMTLSLFLSSELKEEIQFNYNY